MVRHVRHFDFLVDGFDCFDTITFRRRVSFDRFVPANFLFRTLRDIMAPVYETWHREARAMVEMDPPGVVEPEAAVTASGRLVALRHEMARFEANAGEVLSSRLKVRFA